MTTNQNRALLTDREPRRFPGSSLWWWTNIRPGTTAPYPLTSDLPDAAYRRFAEKGLLPEYPDPQSVRGGSCGVDLWRRGAGFLTREAALAALAAIL